MSWKHSGFNIHNGQPIKRSDREGLKRVAQYIIRNPFSEQKMTYNKPSGTVIYRSRLRPVGGQGGRKVIAEGKPARRTKRNFEVFQAEEFIAAITQHIPDKGFQMVRYYGWYSNRARGDRAKRPVNNGGEENQVDIQVIDVSDYTPRRFPSKKWRELIKKVWEVDPMLCKTCGEEMRLIALIDEREVIEKILRHLGLWSEEDDTARGPPDGRILIGEYTVDPVFEFNDWVPFYKS